jgi:hypothetical protein
LKVKESWAGHQHDRIGVVQRLIPPRLRRIGIVALARKLLLALWRYLETGAVPEGAVPKA